MGGAGPDLVHRRRMRAGLLIGGRRCRLSLSGARSDARPRWLRRHSALRVDCLRGRREERAQVRGECGVLGLHRHAQHTTRTALAGTMLTETVLRRARGGVWTGAKRAPVRVQRGGAKSALEGMNGSASVFSARCAASVRTSMLSGTRTVRKQSPPLPQLPGAAVASVKLTAVCAHRTDTRQRSIPQRRTPVDPLLCLES